jgi:hypothetical protein
LHHMQQYENCLMCSFPFCVHVASQEIR